MAFLNKRIEASNSRNNSVESVISYRIGEVEVFRRHETTIKSRSLLDKYLTQEKPDITSENHFERIKYIIDNPRVKVVSFDLFDTLVLRPFWDPTDLFSYIEKKFNLKGFAKLRIEAERKAWTNKTTKEKEDVSFDEIYYYMPNDFKHVKSIEQRLEVDFTYSNPETNLNFARASSILTKRLFL